MAPNLWDLGLGLRIYLSIGLGSCLGLGSGSD